MRPSRAPELPEAPQVREGHLGAHLAHALPSVAEDVSLTETERTRGRALATSLSMRVLSRVWQMLLKGVTEVQEAARPIAAAEMVLVRIAYAADLPTPDEVIRSLDQNGAAPRSERNGGAASPGPSPGPAPRAIMSPSPPAPRGGPRASFAPAAAGPLGEPAFQPEAVSDLPVLSIGTFEAIVALAAEQRDLQIKAALERDMRLVRCEDGRLEIALEPGASKTLVNELSRKLSQWTNRRWMVVVSSEQGTPTLRSQAAVRQAELERGVRDDPLVKAVLDRFPGAEIVGVRAPAAPADPADPPPLEDDTPPIPDPDDDIERMD